MTDGNERVELKHEHEAIRVQMRFLARSLNSLVAKSTEAKGQSTQTKELIASYRLALYDFRDGLQQHIESDERILAHLEHGSSADIIKREHQICRDQVSRAIKLAESATGDQVDTEALEKLGSGIGQAVKQASQSILDHMDREDRILEKG